MGEVSSSWIRSQVLTTSAFFPIARRQSISTGMWMMSPVIRRKVRSSRKAFLPFPGAIGGKAEHLPHRRGARGQGLRLAEMGQGGGVPLVCELIEGLGEMHQGGLAAVLGRGSQDLVTDPFRELARRHRGDGAMTPIMGILPAALSSRPLDLCWLDRLLTWPHVHEKGAANGSRQPLDVNCPAVTYSPRGLLPKYHRRWRVSLPCSEWERVVPRRYSHRTNLRATRQPEHSIASTYHPEFKSKPSAY